MSETNPLPKLITFDGEARSGKGTIVQAVKDHLKYEKNHQVMLIDAGQVFRVLVVGAVRTGVDLENPAAIDAFLRDDSEAERCVQLVKDVYHMEKAERDELLYTNEVGAGSAKVGARPDSQSFKDELLKKWLQDARREGFEVVLLDGRALEEVGNELQREKLCEFVMGLYFVCDPRVGARRTLGHANVSYEDLAPDAKNDVDQLVAQIQARNKADSERAVQPIKPPVGADTWRLPDAPHRLEGDRPMVIFNTSASMTIDEMTKPVERYVSQHLNY